MMFLASTAFAATMLATPALAAPVAVTQADRDMAIQIWKEAIRIPTFKGNAKTPELVRAFTAHLKAAGFTDSDIMPVRVDVEGEPVEGLVVRYAGRNSKLKPVAFLGHMDVVGVLPEYWSTEPFVPTEKDGFIYGRGAADNKAGVVGVLSSFIRLKKQGYVPERDLLIAFSGDEETGMKTTRALTKHPLVSKAEYALNADAGGGRQLADGSFDVSIQSAEKTYVDFELSFSNAGGHSASPRMDNAIYELAAALTAVQNIQFPVRFNEITRLMVADVIRKQGGELGSAMTALLKNPEDQAARAVAVKYPSQSNILWTTCVATMLKAGNAPNALPQNATANVNCRIFPGVSVDDVQAQLQKAVANPKMEIRVVGDRQASPISPINPIVFAKLQKAIDVTHPGVVLKPSMSAGGTDGREFRAAGIPTYGAGNLISKVNEDSRSHGTDERVSIQAFEKQLEYWDALIREVGKAK